MTLPPPRCLKNCVCQPNMRTRKVPRPISQSQSQSSSESGSSERYLALQRRASSAECHLLALPSAVLSQLATGEVSVALRRAR